ncbi:MAG: deoxyribose-phosphate aldolase [Armatimonadetes bacterium]|nr:deoxyribose-phosphate aldolase [Armatimonadota bacterium]
MTHPARAPSVWSPRRLARVLDHSVLSPVHTEQEVFRGCRMVRELGVRTIIVKPSYLRLAVRLLEGAPVHIGTVIGFPHGGETVRMKAAQIREMRAAGAVEFDVVINIGAMREGRERVVAREVEAAVAAARGGLVKVIIETGYLDDEQKVRAARLAAAAGAHFVKTSTGYGLRGATVEDVRLLRDALPLTVGVKASGGIKTLEETLRLLEAGAARIGTSSTRAIMEAALERQPVHA